MVPTKFAVSLLSLLLAASTAHARDLAFLQHSRALKCSSIGTAYASSTSFDQATANAVQQAFSDCSQMDPSQSCDAIAEAQAKVSRRAGTGA